MVWRRMPALRISRSDRLFLEEMRADFLVQIGDGGDEIAVSLIDHRLVIGGDLLDCVGRSHDVVVGIDDGLAVDDVELAR